MRCPACWRPLPPIGHSGVFSPTELIMRCEYLRTEPENHFGLIGQLKALS